MEKKEHPHADILRAIADGLVEVEQQDGDGHWFTRSARAALYIMGQPDLECNFRLKPTPMCELAGIKFPVPMKEAPTHGTTICVAAVKGAFRIDWLDLETDNAFLSSGLCHTTEEAAQAHSEALRAVNLMAIEGAK